MPASCAVRKSYAAVNVSRVPATPRATSNARWYRCDTDAQDDAKDATEKEEDGGDDSDSLP